MKTNITVVCLLNSFSKKVCKDLADKLDMYFVDVGDLMEFYFSDIHDVVQKCGEDYLKQIESNTVKDVSMYDNSIVTADHRFLTDAKNFKKLKEKSTVVYLRIKKELFDAEVESIKKWDEKNSMRVEGIVFEENDQLFSNNSDFIVPIASMDEKAAIKAMLKSINQFFNL